MDEALAEFQAKVPAEGIDFLTLWGQLSENAKKRYRTLVKQGLVITTVYENGATITTMGGSN